MNRLIVLVDLLGARLLALVSDLIATLVGWEDELKRMREKVEGQWQRSRQSFRSGGDEPATFCVVDDRSPARGGYTDMVTALARKK